MENGTNVHVEGSNASIMLALSILSSNLLEETNLSKEDILDAIQHGFKKHYDRED